MKDLASVDFFAVPAVTFKVLFVFVLLAHPWRWARQKPEASPEVAGGAFEYPVTCAGYKSHHA